MTSVYVSAVINLPCAKAWKTIREFDSISRWHPLVSNCIIEDGLPADKIGCVRKMTMKDGQIIRELLLGMSDYDREYTYSILESPMSVSNYVANLKITPITDGDRSFIEWSAEFECPQEDKTSLEEFISRDVFQAGLEAFAKHMGV